MDISGPLMLDGKLVEPAVPYKKPKSKMKPRKQLTPEQRVINAQINADRRARIRSQQIAMGLREDKPQRKRHVENTSFFGAFARLGTIEGVGSNPYFKSYLRPSSNDQAAVIAMVERPPHPPHDESSASAGAGAGAGAWAGAGASAGASAKSRGRADEAAKPKRPKISHGASTHAYSASAAAVPAGAKASGAAASAVVVVQELSAAQHGGFLY